VKPQQRRRLLVEAPVQQPANRRMPPRLAEKPGLVRSQPKRKSNTLLPSRMFTTAFRVSESPRTRQLEKAAEAEEAEALRRRPKVPT